MSSKTRKQSSRAQRRPFSDREETAEDALESSDGLWGNVLGGAQGKAWSDGLWSNVLGVARGEAWDAGN